MLTFLLTDKESCGGNLEYCIEIWDSYEAEYCHADRFQRKFSRYLNKRMYGYNPLLFPLLFLYEMNGLDTLELRHKVRSVLQYVFFLWVRWTTPEHLCQTCMSAQVGADISWLRSLCAAIVVPIMRLSLRSRVHRQYYRKRYRSFTIILAQDYNIFHTVAQRLWYSAMPRITHVSTYDVLRRYARGVTKKNSNVFI